MKQDYRKLGKGIALILAVAAVVMFAVGYGRCEDTIEEEGRVGDWVFRPDASLPFFMITFNPTLVSFNEAGVGLGLSVTRETGSVFDPKFAFYLYPKSKADSGSMDLSFGGEVSLLSVGRFHLLTVGGMYSITEEIGALTIGVSAGLMK